MADKNSVNKMISMRIDGIDNDMIDYLKKCIQMYSIRKVSVSDVIRYALTEACKNEGYFDEPEEKL